MAVATIWPSCLSSAARQCRGLVRVVRETRSGWQNVLRRYCVQTVVLDKAQQLPSDGEGDGLSERLIVTGHILEWWALCPAELHPPRSVIISAGQWMVRTVDQLSDEKIQSSQVFLTHVGRGLALWRRRSPMGGIRAAVQGDITGRGEVVPPQEVKCLGAQFLHDGLRAVR